MGISLSSWVWITKLKRPDFLWPLYFYHYCVEFFNYGHGHIGHCVSEEVKTLYDSSKKIENYVTCRYFNCRYSIKYLLNDSEISHLHVQFHSIKMPWCWWHSHLRQFPLAQYLLWYVLNYAIKNCTEEREDNGTHLMNCLGGDSSGQAHCRCLRLHGHWLQQPFEWKQKRNRGGQTNETAHPPTIGLS